MREKERSPEQRTMFSVQDIDEQTALEARRGGQDPADIIDALLDLHEQRLKRPRGQVTPYDHDL